MSGKPESHSPASPKPLTILVVEDDEAIGDFLQLVITGETPHAVLLTTDATQALEAVETIIPGLFILDYQLPGINGLELYDRLHAIKGLETVPALMISSNRLSNADLQHRQIAFLRKPFELAKLLQIIERLLLPPHGE
jgi:CheY-like chemotaxis protein